MEKIITFCAFFMLCAIFMSCESEIRVEDVVGKWCLISIESEINGEPSSEPIYLTEGEVYYEFRNDLKYVLNDLGTNECGSWILRNDSLLGTLPNDCEDDSINYTWMKINSLSDSVMTMCSIINTDYGVVDEICVYKKM